MSWAKVGEGFCLGLGALGLGAAFGWAIGTGLIGFVVGLLSHGAR